MNKKIIGLVGKLQTGKTTSSNIIKELYKDQFDIIYQHSFANLLKEMIWKAGICTKEELWGEKTEFSRMMLQKIGTEIIRKQVSENFWVNKMIDRIKNSLIPNKKILIIIDDVRFKNEADLIKWFEDGILIKITRPNSLTNNKQENNHLSETELDSIKVDYKIFNDGDLNDLKEKIIKILKDII